MSITVFINVEDNKYQYYPVFCLHLYKDANRLNIKPFESQYDNLGNVLSNIWECLKGI